MNGWIISVCNIDCPRATDHTCSLPCFCTDLRCVRKMCFLKSKGSQKTSTISWYQKRGLLTHWQWRGDSTREQNFWAPLWSAFTKPPRKVCILRLLLHVSHQWLSEVDGAYYTWCDNLLAFSTLARNTFVYYFDLSCCFCHGCDCTALCLWSLTFLPHFYYYVFVTFAAELLLVVFLTTVTCSCCSLVITFKNTNTKTWYKYNTVYVKYTQLM